MKRAGIIVNHDKEACLNLAKRLASYLNQKGVALLPGTRGDFWDARDLPNAEFSDHDIAFVIGGDGTLLSAGRSLAVSHIPILGVNMGRVGFLAEVEPEQLLNAVDRLLLGEYSISERIMLHCSVLRAGVEVDSYQAFNDAVINNGIDARMVDLDLSIDGQAIHSYHADGIIVATPTGSTGYSFSAGGPVVLPDLNLMLVVPICPHTFFSRPIIAPPTSVVEIICRSSGVNTCLAADGQLRINIQPDDKILIRVSDQRVKMVRLGEYSPLTRLKNKFNRI